MIEFSNHVTVGEVILGIGLAGGMMWNYFGVIRRQDKLESLVEKTDDKIEDLKRGRGLIMGETSDWPNAVRRCFGFGPNGHAAADR